MTEHKILFRGFHPDGNSTTTISLNGDKIRGEWVYGSLLECKPMFVDKVERTIVYHNGSGFCYDKVIPETIGQWVKTDKNGKDVFEGDRGICWTITNDRMPCEIVYSQERARFEVACEDGDYFGLWEISNFELIGNKWESEVTK